MAPRLRSRWLFLVHQIPPKPDYLRVKIGRRLQQVGAVALKNSVYALPSSREAQEDFEWISREVAAGGGDAFLSEARLVGGGLTDDDIRSRFDAARTADFRAIGKEARALFKSIGRGQRAGRGGAAAEARRHARAVARLRRRYDEVRKTDFFSSAEGTLTRTVLTELDMALVRAKPIRPDAPRVARPRGATWVTRKGIKVDRIGCAWLVRRFIDRRARFRFVEPAGYVPRRGEIRFDMFDAEYTHVGELCSFEHLREEFVRGDRALAEIAEIVHDVDCKDAKFGRPEAAGLARMIAGIAALCRRDEDRLERGRRLFDELYAAFARTPPAG